MALDYGKYERLGAFHWTEYALGTIYGRHADAVATAITARPVLDVGCGDGLITALLDGYGIDLDQVGVNLAVERRVRATVGDVTRLPRCLPATWPRQYAAVYCGDVLEHLDDPKRALKAISTVTSTLYLATPPRGLEAPDPHHVHEFTRDELIRFLDRAGWRHVWSRVDHHRIFGQWEKTRWTWFR